MIGPKTKIFAQLAEVAGTLAHATRLELLEHVAQGERSVERLAELTHQSVANTSQHLQRLRRNGLVQSRRDGKRILYELGGGPIIQLMSALRELAEHNCDSIRKITSAYFDRLDMLEPVSRDEVLRRLREKSITLLDVRPKDEFASGHLPGALNIPSEELKRRLKTLPKDLEIVAYCRGSYCVLSFEAVAALRVKGYKVRRLVEGFPEWKAAGLQVDFSERGDIAVTSSKQA